MRQTLQNINKCLTIIFILLLSVLVEQKADAAPTAGDLLNRERDLNQLNKIPKDIPKDLREEQPAPIPKQEEFRVLIKDFEFQGEITLFTKEQLKEVLKDLTNKELTFKEILGAAQKIRDFYKLRGFFLTNVTVPNQEIIDGKVILIILEGKLDTKQPYQINGKNLRLQKESIKQYFTEAFTKRLDENSLDRAILNLNNNPGITASVTLRPGSTPGTTAMIINVDEGPMMTGTVGGNNYGSQYTGALKTNVSLNIQNPLEYGDAIKLQVSKAPKDNFDFHQLEYEFPIGRSGLRSNILYNRLEYKIGKELATTPMTMGVAKTYDIHLRYPLYLTSGTSLFVGTGYVHNNFYNETTGVITSNKRVDSYDLQLEAKHVDEWFLGAYTLFNISNNYGTLDLTHNASDYANDQSAARTHGDYKKTNIDVVRIQKLSSTMNLNIVGKIQYANKNLDSSQKISLGGPVGVRAFPAGEASGDEGRKISVDLKYKVPNQPPTNPITLSAFYDYGRIRQYKNTENINMTTANEYSLAGWGLALDFSIFQVMNLQLGWADALGGNEGKSSQGKNSDGRGDMSRYWLSFSFLY